MLHVGIGDWIWAFPVMFLEKSVLKSEGGEKSEVDRRRGRDVGVVVVG